MCKLLLNIVPNVYNSLQSSFLSLSWPWSGRSLPRGPVRVLGPWSGAQCGWAPSLPATPSASYTPTYPLHPFCPPDAPDTPTPPMPPDAPNLLLSPQPLHLMPAPDVSPMPLHPLLAPYTL